MHQLPSDRLHLARPLFEDSRFHGSILAVLAGTADGEVLVDSLSEPAVAVLSGPEGIYLGLSPDADPSLARRHIADWAYVYEPSATGMREDALPHPHFVQHARLAYRLDASAPQPQTPALPMGARLRAADLDGVEIEIDGALVSWCRPDCSVPGYMEIGVGTIPGFRRRGLAHAAAATMTSLAAAAGYAVGWHCHASNRASRALARRLGFDLVAEYTARSASLPAENAGDLHEAELLHLAGRFRDGAADFNWLRFHAAAAFCQAGQTNAALDDLHALVRNGWSGRRDWLESHWAFEPLQGSPAFLEVLARLPE
ncbi:hypothetical protein VE25_06155 [Devosia geojensis]|uniref:N-acetyltransferase domain-containing protein n=1 Tax=Devosia geojensis TaxID=443610 RepID=A0A0F5FUI8_9HYPH|nr:GNAT family N-acetyltransferase [Devosia geojensis]KKB12516.1 hypothetical protein VE25_06155 [Devosia geojensis]